MRTVRIHTFETNSSSAHCFVTADNEEFARFVNGELFADGFGYKGRHSAKLIDEDAAYMRYEKYFIDYVITMDSNSRILSKDTLLWFLRHPVEIAPLIEGNGDTPLAQGFNAQGFGDSTNTVPEMPEAIYNECYSNYWGVLSLITWLDNEEAPLSYAKLVDETSNFEKGYDGYDSEPPTDKDGKTSCYAVWYY